jgi:hypothetical protein
MVDYVGPTGESDTRYWENPDPRQEEVVLAYNRKSPEDVPSLGWDVSPPPIYEFRDPRKAVLRYLTATFKRVADGMGLFGIQSNSHALTFRGMPICGADVVQVVAYLEESGVKFEGDIPGNDGNTMFFSHRLVLHSYDDIIRGLGWWAGESMDSVDWSFRNALG